MNADALKTRVIDAADKLGVSFNEAFHQLVMERFLARLAASKHQSKLIFKGGFLLAHYVDLGRDTRDLDFLVKSVQAEKSVIESILLEIASVKTEDSFQFNLVSMEDLPHEHMKYGGFRANFRILLGKIRESVEIDIGVGDLVDAQENTLKLMTGKGKPIFEGEISLLVYPPETILAEKLQTLVARGEVNSRMKDYFDILTILKTISLESVKVTDAIQVTFGHRQTDFNLLPIQFSDENVAKLQKYWSAFFRDLRKKDGTPSQVRDVIAAINLELKKIGIA